MWPEGAVFARDMERGFQCRLLGNTDSQLRTEFNCDSGAIASSVLQCSERGSNGPLIRIFYGNYGRTASNSQCFPNGLSDVSCISPRASRFIEDSCNGKHRCRLDLPILLSSYLGQECTNDGQFYLDVQYECYEARTEEEIQITNLDSIRDTPLRELYSDILHFVADPEGENLAKKVRLARLKNVTDSEMLHDYELLELVTAKLYEVVSFSCECTNKTNCSTPRLSLK